MLRLFSFELLEHGGHGEVVLEEGLQSGVYFGERELLYDEIEGSVLLLVQARQVLARQEPIFPQEIPQKDVFVDPECAVVGVDD